MLSNIDYLEPLWKRGIWNQLREQNKPDIQCALNCFYEQAERAKKETMEKMIIINELRSSLNVLKNAGEDKEIEMFVSYYR